ncbi:MAG: LysM peptidoglycan-binding domain-containing protein [Thermomicrobiales bacterium]
MMASPWVTSQRPPAERPWLGIALLAAIPLVSLILIRMLWSGSSLWFLTVGIILLGAAAIVFLARRTQEHEYSRQTLAPETTRVPLILMGLGVLFLAMLVLPNYAGGGSSNDRLSRLSDEQTSAASSDVSGVSQQASTLAQSTTQQQPRTNSTTTQPQQTTQVEGETYVVQSGDTLWDIAVRYDTTVAVIVSANRLTDETDIQIGQELTIPAASSTGTTGSTTDDPLDEPLGDGTTTGGATTDDGTGDESVP